MNISRSASQTSPYTDQPDANNPSFPAGQQRRRFVQQGQANIPQAITGGIPAGGTTPFAGAQQTLGEQPGYNWSGAPNGPGAASNGGFDPNGGVAGNRHTQPYGGRIENTQTGASQPTGQSQQPQAGSQSSFDFSNNSDDTKVSAYIRQQIAGGMTPQQAADDANQKFNMPYGRQAVYYPDTNTIGLHTLYMAGAGNFNDTMRGPEGQGGGQGGGGFNSDIINNAIMGQNLAQQTTPTDPSQSNSPAIWQQIIQALQAQSQLK